MQKKIVQEYRTKRIEGKCIDLIPMSDDYLERVVKLRNQNNSVYFLNQGSKLTYEMQVAWFEEYKSRQDDIYWAIVNKQNEFVGTIRLYQITQEICDQGSFIIDEKYSKGEPYALEAELLSIKFAFEILKVSAIMNENRADNKNMNSITKRLGFTYIKDINVRGITYKYYELYQKDFKPEKYEKLISYWSER